MELGSKRLYPRNDCRAAAVFTMTGGSDYAACRILNCSKNGLYGESGEAVAPEADLDVIMPGYTPSACGPERFQFYETRCAWCRPIPDSEHPCYGFGLRVIKRGHQKGGTDAEPICQTCDLCASAIPCDEVRRIDDLVYLCPVCHRHVQSMPPGHLRRSMRRLLMGNVV
jgi:hypothetical protein